MCLLQSPSAAAIVVAQPASRPVIPPPSQPRRGSTAPTLFCASWHNVFAVGRPRSRTQIPQTPTNPVGAVELQRGCESGGSASINASRTAAIAASPGLDSSHIILCQMAERVRCRTPALRSADPANPDKPCGSCRASARLRKRWLSQNQCQPYRRHRSLAGARQPPHYFGPDGITCSL